MLSARCRDQSIGGLIDIAAGTIPPSRTPGGHLEIAVGPSAGGKQDKILRMIRRRRVM